MRLNLVCAISCSSLRVRIRSPHVGRDIVNPKDPDLLWRRPSFILKALLENKDKLQRQRRWAWLSCDPGRCSLLFLGLCRGRRLLSGHRRRLSRPGADYGLGLGGAGGALWGAAEGPAVTWRFGGETDCPFQLKRSSAAPGVDVSRGCSKCFDALTTQWAGPSGFKRNPLVGL